MQSGLNESSTEIGGPRDDDELLCSGHSDGGWVDGWRKEVKPEDIKRYWDLHRRHWELNVAVTGMKNEVNKDLNVFFAVEVRRIDDIKKKLSMRPLIMPKYTTVHSLAPHQDIRFQQPEELYIKQFLKLSYKDLKTHILKMDMWKSSSITFNTYYGTTKPDLHRIATTRADSGHMLKKVAPLHSQKPERRPDILHLRCDVRFEEVFDFELMFDNWNLMLDYGHQKLKTHEADPIGLTFLVPRNKYGRAAGGGRLAAIKRGARPMCSCDKIVTGSKLDTDTSHKQYKMFAWPHPGKASFTGTKTDLRNAC